MATAIGLLVKALGLAESILNYLNEGKAAGIIEIVKKFFGDLGEADFDFAK